MGSLTGTSKRLGSIVNMCGCRSFFQARSGRNEVNVTSVTPFITLPCFLNIATLLFVRHGATPRCLQWGTVCPCPCTFAGAVTLASHFYAKTCPPLTRIIQLLDLHARSCLHSHRHGGQRRPTAGSAGTRARTPIQRRDALYPAGHAGRGL